MSRVDEVAVALELAQQVERLEVAVHRVRAGDADGGEAAAAGPRRAGSARRRPTSGIAARTRSIAAASRSSPVGTPPDADDLGVLGELARPVDAGELERPRRGECGVEVDERQQRRAAAGRLFDQRAADAGFGERVVVEPESEHPLVRGAAGTLLGDERAAPPPGSVTPIRSAPRAPSAPRNGCRWLSVIPGTTAAPCRSMTSVARAGQLADLGIRADRLDRAARDRDRGRRRALGVERADARAHQCEIRSCGSSFVVGAAAPLWLPARAAGRWRAAAACTSCCGASRTLRGRRRARRRARGASRSPRR